MSAYPLLLHVVSCLWYYVFWNNFLTTSQDGDKSNWDPKYQNVHEMSTRFLTNWNLISQTLFFAGCLFHDIMKIINGPNWFNVGSKFQILLSLSFSSIILPTGLFICITFWLMYAFDREVVYPKVIDNYLPFWLNHGMHTIILPLVLTELFTTRHKFPPVKISVYIIAAFELVYAIVFLETYFEKGRWVYPLFEMYSLPISLTFMILLLAKLMSFIFVGIFIQNLYWGQEVKKQNRIPIKKSK